MNQNGSTMRIDLIPEISEIPLAVRARKEPSAQAPTAAPAPDPEPAPVPAPAGVDRLAVYGELFLNLYDAALVTDLHGRIRDVNPRAEAMFGFTPTQFSHMTIGQLANGATPELIRTLYESIRREQRFTLMQATCFRAGGEKFPAEVVVSTVHLSTPHLCFCIRDETVRQATDAMLRTEHNALQNASDSIVVIGLDSRIQYANPATLRTWGYAGTSDLIGKPVGHLLLTETDGDVIIHSITGETFETTGEAIARHANGDPFRVEVHAACNRDSDGTAIGAVVSFTDLSDRERFEVAEHDIQMYRDSVKKLSLLHKALRTNIEECDAFLSRLKETAAGLSCPSLLTQLEELSGNVAGLSSISDEGETLFRQLEEAPPPPEKDPFTLD